MRRIFKNTENYYIRYLFVNMTSGRFRAIETHIYMFNNDMCIFINKSVEKK